MSACGFALPEKDAASGRMRPGDCLIFVAGQPPVYGQQIVYFADAVLGARGAIQAPSKRDEAPRRSLSPRRGAHGEGASSIGVDRGRLAVCDKIHLDQSIYFYWLPGLPTSV